MTFSSHKNHQTETLDHKTGESDTCMVRYNEITRKFTDVWPIASLVYLRCVRIVFRKGKGMIGRLCYQPIWNFPAIALTIQTLHACSAKRLLVEGGCSSPQFMSEKCNISSNFCSAVNESNEFCEDIENLPMDILVLSKSAVEKVDFKRLVKKIGYIFSKAL